MSFKKRKILIAGNWKMNKTKEQTKDFLEKLNPLVLNASCEVLLCVPFLDLEQALEKTANSNVKIAAQNCHFEDSGAFTGEVSVLMLKELGVKNVLVGHSERRQFFGETNSTVNLKLKKILKNDMSLIVCVGENLNQRENFLTEEILSIQIKTAFSGILKSQMQNVVVAYEPVWAIGTGKSASKEQAQLACKKIRDVLEEVFDKEVAQNVLILYGGSLNTKNAEEILQQNDIDGGLIGGASLDALEFSKIVGIANSF